MWIYQETHNRADPGRIGELGWTVGFYTPSGAWRPIRDCDTDFAAADLVHFLNGGTATL